MLVMGIWPHEYVERKILHDTPVEVIESYANRVRSATGHSVEEQIDLSKVCNLAGYLIRIVNLGYGGKDGLLFPISKNRFQASIDPRPQELRKLSWVPTSDQAVEWDRRKRFIIAHEIGHSFFYFRDEKQEEAPWRRKRMSFREERFCEEFARQLLIPREAIASKEQSVKEVANLFNVPRELADIAINGNAMLEPYSSEKEYKYKII